jgi:protein-tyrosine-phosphatase
MKRILFVCTGNSCRSPMAEALAAARLPEPMRDSFVLSSAGTSAFDGMQAATNAIKVLAEIGIDLSAHRARLLTKGMVDEADLVVVMAEAHREEILDLAPGSAGKVILLGELDNTRESPDVSDPIGGDEEVYRKTRDEIGSLVAQLTDYLSEIFRVS